MGDHYGLVETTVRWHEPTQFDKARLVQNRREFVAPQGAVDREEVATGPSRISLLCDVQMDGVLPVTGPIPNLVADASMYAILEEGRWRHRGMLFEDLIVIAYARQKQSTRTELSGNLLNCPRKVLFIEQVRERIVNGDCEIKIGFRDGGKVTHVRHLELDRQVPLLCFASGSADSELAQINPHQSMSSLGQPKRLRADAAGAVENSQGSGWNLSFNERAQNGCLPPDGLCPVLEHQVVTFRKIVVERPGRIAHT